MQLIMRPVLPSGRSDCVCCLREW